MKEIKQMDPFSLAKIWGVMYAILGLVIGLCVAAFGSLFSKLNPESGAAIGSIFGTMGLIVFPILYGGIGLVAGLLGGFLYNVIARMVGGIRIELGD